MWKKLGEMGEMGEAGEMGDIYGPGHGRLAALDQPIVFGEGKVTSWVKEMADVFAGEIAQGGRSGLQAEMSKNGAGSMSSTISQKPSRTLADALLLPEAAAFGAIITSR
ncbi:hypothetical protein PG985_006392 [Apiospora marii]|uniref:Uncharacterized protein n=1 Tax=Apiospora marii TaxID=335849 RepID=A0ABR1S7H1_9PEZI